MDIEEIVSTSTRWLLEAGEIAKQALQNGFDVDTKVNRKDLVTNVDKTIEKLFVDKVSQYYPKHRLLGEEGQGDKVTELNGIVWVLDPIDGTMNFVIKKRDFAITLGIYEEGIGIIGFVYDVMKNHLYRAVKDKGATLNGTPLPVIDPDLEIQDALFITDYTDLKTFPRIEKVIESSYGLRFHGAAAIEFIEVATGRAGAFLHTYLNPWDIGGGKIIVEELGGKVTRVDGSTINMSEKGSVLVAAPKIHKAILKKCFTHYPGE